MTCLMITRLVLVTLLVEQVTSAPDVSTPVGVLKGFDRSSTTSNTPLHVYYGIPFAAAPVGDLRFKPPQAFTSDDASKVITSDNFRPACPQTQTFGNTMDEDCLFLNVYTPSTGGADFDTCARKKVYVFIHGGAFQVGDASPYPLSSMSADYDLIVVTIQYRLGPLGFMSSGTEALPGNYGLRDQIFALQWIKDNIANFGGDPDDVTLTGESAGSTSVSLISLSPLSKGLFSKAILMSGSALSPWAIDMTNRETFDKMAERSNCLPDPCEEDCDSKVVECLRNIGAMDLVNLIAQDARVSEEDIFALDGYMSYAPVVDGDVLPRDPFDLMTDKEYLKNIGALDREYMIGVDNNEAMLFVLPSVWSKVIELTDLLNIDTGAAQEVVINNLHSVFPYPVSKATMNLVVKQYYNPRDANGLSELKTAVNFMTDIDFVVPAVQFANHLLQASSDVKVFLFLFDLYPPITVPNFPLTGSTHGLELAYMCDEDCPLAPMLFYTNVYADECKPLIGIFRGMLANFALNGDPSLTDGVTWPQYNTCSKKYMAISATPEVRTDLYKSRVDLWTVDLPKVLGMTTFLRGHGRAPIPEVGNVQAMPAN